MPAVLFMVLSIRCIQRFDSVLPNQMLSNAPTLPLDLRLWITFDCGTAAQVRHLGVRLDLFEKLTYF